MFCRVLLARRASPFCLHRRTYRSKPPSSTLDKVQQAVVEALPLCRRPGVNQQKVRRQIKSLELSIVTCRQQQTFNDGRADDSPQSLKDSHMLLCQPDSLSAKTSTLKLGRSRKGESLKQSIGSHGDVKEDAQKHSVYVTETTKAKGKKSDGDVSDGAFNSTNSSVPLQPVEIVSKCELPRKVKLAERLCPMDAASLLKIKAFKRCSFKQLENVVGVLEDCLLSSEKVFRVLVRRPQVALHSADLLQQKLQVLINFQIEKETIARVCIQGSLLRSSAQSLQEKLAFLEELGLNVNAKNKLLCRAPYATAFTVENLKKTLDFLIDKGATKEGISRIVQKCPQVLWLSCESNLIPRYHFFQQIGIPPQRLPPTICYASRTALDTLKAHMLSLEDLGFSSHEVCLMLQKQPDLLWSCKIQKLKMTLDFLVHEQKHSMAYIVHYPKVFLFSLKDRIIPRCRRLEERGLSRVYSLATILTYSDAQFGKMLSK